MVLPVTEIIADHVNHEITVICEGKYVITENDFLSLGIEKCGTADIEKLTFCSEKLSCIKKSMNLLSYGDMSSKKLREKLTTKYPRDIVEAVICLLVSKGCINDTELSERYAVSLAKSRLWGKKRIEEYLFLKGFNRDDIKNASSQIDDELLNENLNKVISKNMGKYNLSEYKSRAKLGEFLYRYGYTWDEIKSALAMYEKE